MLSRFGADKELLLMWSEIFKIRQFFVMIINRNVIYCPGANRVFLFSDSFRFLLAINLLHLQFKFFFITDLWLNMHIFHHWLTFKYNDYQRHHCDVLYDLISTHLQNNNICKWIHVGTFSHSCIVIPSYAIPGNHHIIKITTHNTLKSLLKIWRCGHHYSVSDYNHRVRYSFPEPIVSKK